MSGYNIRIGLTPDQYARLQAKGTLRAVLCELIQPRLPWAAEWPALIAGAGRAFVQIRIPAEMVTHVERWADTRAETPGRALRGAMLALIGAAPAPPAPTEEVRAALKAARLANLARARKERREREATARAAAPPEPRHRVAPGPVPVGRTGWRAKSAARQARYADLDACFLRQCAAQSHWPGGVEPPAATSRGDAATQPAGESGEGESEC